MIAIDLDEDNDPYDVFSAAMGVPKAHQLQIARKDHKNASAKGKGKAFGGWGSTPALEKLHNLAVWLRNSSIYYDLWDQAIGISLGIDNDTGGHFGTR